MTLCGYCQADRRDTWFVSGFRPVPVAFLVYIFFSSTMKFSYFLVGWSVICTLLPRTSNIALSLPPQCCLHGFCNKFVSKDK